MATDDRTLLALKLSPKQAEFLLALADGRRHPIPDAWDVHSAQRCLALVSKGYAVVVDIVGAGEDDDRGTTYAVSEDDTGVVYADVEHMRLQITAAGQGVAKVLAADPAKALADPRSKRDCATCGGEGRDPHNKDRACTACYGKGKVAA